MSTLSGEYTLLDIKAMHDPEGNVAKVIDVLSEVNGVMQDAIWMEANDLTSHVITQALSEGAGSAGVINQGVAYEEDRVKQVREQMEIFESYSRIDERLVSKARNPEQFRAQKDAMRIRGMAKSWHTRFFYGDQSENPAAVNGLATRYNDLSMDNVISAGGSGGDTTSIWLVQWGEDGCHLIYPRGERTMIEQEDLGRQLISDTNGVYTALVNHYMINWGLAVADDRAVQRIANIESSGSSNIFDEDDLITAITNLPDPSNLERTRIYVNRTIMAQMQIALKDKTNVWFDKTDGLSGAPVLTFQGIPVRLVDKLVDTETVVS